VYDEQGVVLDVTLFRTALTVTHEALFE
jgi:hypothetical protein